MQYFHPQIHFEETPSLAIFKIFFLYLHPRIPLQETSIHLTYVFRKEIVLIRPLAHFVTRTPAGKSKGRKNQNVNPVRRL